MANKLKLHVKIDQLGLNNQISGPNGEEIDGVLGVSSPIIPDNQPAYVLVKIGIESGRLQLGGEFVELPEPTVGWAGCNETQR